MSEGIDAWVSRPARAEVEEVTASLPEPLEPTGASAPQLGMPMPPPTEMLPTRPQTHFANVWVLGTHGGAGETTIAALSADWKEAGHAWPHVPGDVPRVLLVARSNMAGLRAAQAAATQWAAGGAPGIELLGLVIVHDAPGRLPRQLRDFIQVVSGGVPRTWQVPWNESWRLGGEISTENVSREVRRLVGELNVITGNTRGTN